RSAHDVVEDLLEQELKAIELDPAYMAAVAKVEELQKPILDRLSEQINQTLKEVLQNVKKARVRVAKEDRYRALRRSCQIIIDDGTPTVLERKGDGVQSLAAL